MPAKGKSILTKRVFVLDFVSDFASDFVLVAVVVAAAAVAHDVRVVPAAEAALDALVVPAAVKQPLTKCLSIIAQMVRSKDRIQNKIETPLQPSRCQRRFFCISIGMTDKGRYIPFKEEKRQSR
jgi:uncharacterized protein (DUF1778 family)